MRWLAAVVLVVMAAVPSQALAADCADPGAPGQFDAFVRGGLTTANMTVQGRVAAGGDANLTGPNIGTSPPLTPDPNRADLIVGGNLTVQNGGTVGQGRATYGGTFNQVNGGFTALGGVTQAPPPFDFAAQFDTLIERSAQWADLAPTGTVQGTGYNVQFTGSDPTLNVFRVTASQLQAINGPVFNVPAGSAVLVDVTMDTTDASFTGVLNAFSGPAPENILWNFPLAKGVHVQSWTGTILAPHAAVSIGNGTYRGSVAADSLTINGITLEHHPFTGCVPPKPPETLALTAVCTDRFTHHSTMRLRNTGNSARDATWSDGTGQSDHFTVPANSDEFFDVLDGTTVHHIVVTSGSTTLTQDTSTRECAGTIVVHKVVTGLGAAPPGPWRIVITGTNSFSTSRDLADGQAATVNVPGGAFQTGAFPIGRRSGGYQYYTSEPDSLGATVSVDRNPVTILDGPPQQNVTVGNDYEETPEPPIPQPPDPDLPPDSPDPPPAPDLITSPSLDAGADLVVSERITPRTLTVGDVVSVTARVRNRGPLTAEGTVVREIPQLDPTRPNRVAQILGVKSTVRAAAPCTSARPLRCGGNALPAGGEIVIRVRARVRNRGPLTAEGTVVREIPQLDPTHPNRVAQILGVKSTVRAAAPCTSARPLRCGGNALPAGGEIVIRVRARILVAGVLKSVIEATSKTPDPNASNNFAATGLLVAQVTPVVRVAVRSPAVTKVGVPVSYRVVVRGAGSDGARFVRFCHRPAPGLLVTSAPGTFRSRGRLCRDVRRLRKGQQAGFTVHAIASARAAGRRLRLRATANAPAARRAVASDHIAVIGQSFAGTGRG